MPEQLPIGYCADELGRHFFENIVWYRMLAFSYVRDRKVAEDLVSDSFIRLWEHKEDLRPERGDFRPYIVRIVKNTCLQYLRQQTVHQRIENSLHEREAWQFRISIDSLEAMDAEKRLFSGEVEAIVNRCLDGMPRLRREIFTASRLRAMTHREIAEAYGISERRVVQEIQQVLRVLRVQLKDYMPVFVALFCFMEIK